MTLPLILLIISIAARSCAELALHGKLRWSDGGTGFWGEESYWRKYANPIDPPPDYLRFWIGKKHIRIPVAWYYKMFKIGYMERFPLSATLLVSLTDGYHAAQSVYFICLALSISILSNVNFFLIWIGILLTHFVTYRLLQR
jgi:hypothetical protein